MKCRKLIRWGSDFTRNQFENRLQGSNNILVTNEAQIFTVFGIPRSRKNMQDRKFVVAEYVGAGTLASKRTSHL